MPYSCLADCDIPENHSFCVDVDLILKVKSLQTANGIECLCSLVLSKAVLIVMAGVSFLDLLFAEATGMARVRDARSREPDNFFLLPRDPRAWRQIRAASKKENMVIAVEITDNVNENCQRMQRVFVDLAREFDCIPFMRVEIGGGEGGTYDEVYVAVYSRTTCRPYVPYLSLP